MAEYIERDAFIKRLENEADRSSGIIDLLILNGIANIVRDNNIAPSADVVEVVHGEWVEKRWYKRGDCYYTKNCSLCDCAVKPKYTYNFCPNCGAKMRGDVDEGKIET